MLVVDLNIRVEDVALELDILSRHQAQGHLPNLQGIFTKVI